MHLRVKPSLGGALALWAGSDHYDLTDALRREPFTLPTHEVKKVYRMDSARLPWLPQFRRYAVEYSSGRRDCFVLLPELPPELIQKEEPEQISFYQAAALLMEHVRREPTVFLLPLVVPVGFFLCVALFGLWNQLVLHNLDFLSFFVRPGCDVGCVRKVLSIHSLVALLFLLQFLMLFLPIGLWLFQAPRYRSALNYRMIQSYSAATMVVGAVIFAQLVVFFPFRQYGRFVELGFHPKIEKAFADLKAKK